LEPRRRRRSQRARRTEGHETLTKALTHYAVCTWLSTEYFEKVRCAALAARSVRTTGRQVLLTESAGLSPTADYGRFVTRRLRPRADIRKLTLLHKLSTIQHMAYLHASARIQAEIDSPIRRLPCSKSAPAGITERPENEADLRIGRTDAVVRRSLPTLLCRRVVTGRKPT
jgi:hypothetical protein